MDYLTVKRRMTIGNRPVVMGSTIAKSRIMTLRSKTGFLADHALRFGR